MSNSEPIKVVIVDDHPIIRHGIKMMLLTFDDISVIGEAGNGLEALTRCQEALPDVILMDVAMPQMNGVEATRAILDRCPQVKIIMLTTYPDQDIVQESLEAGAIGFLLKDTPINTFGNAIRSAYAGQSTLSPEATQALLKAKTQPTKLGHDLSDREVEILALLVEGLSNDEIAEQLVISPNTVRKHVSACMVKLEASNRAEAAAKAVRLEIIP